VGTLVAGPGVFICDACITLCQELIATKTGAGTVPLAPFESMNSADEVLGCLPQVAGASAQTERYLVAGVRRARELGATWARIGAVLGMARQSAWERFSGEE
jgi:ATP-dependent protease Clp ATPase subunit